MVDCGNSRCLQEKRSFKKELLSWSKKIPIAIGLERIAEELAGESIIKDLLYPFNDLEKKEKEDWKQEQNCFFCESRLKMMFEALEKLMDEVKSGKNLQDNPSLRYLQELLPYCPQFYTHNVGREILAELKTGHVGEKDVEMNIPQTQKEPIELKIPHIVAHARQKAKESPQSCKKAYTDDELTAAVNEIQSGKLGTRRASVLYGIPRSTLRNKMFRMGTDKQSTYQINGEDGYEDALAAEIALKWTDLIQGSFRPLFIHQLPLMLNPDFKVLEMCDDTSNEKKLEYIRKKHNLGRKKEKYHSEYAHELKFPFLKKIMKKLIEERFEMERNADRVRKMGKKEVPKSQAAKPTEVPSLPTTSDADLSDIIIPSYKTGMDSKSISEQLSHSFDKYENTRLGDTLKDIIVKTISEKVRGKSQALADFCSGAFKMETDSIKSEPQSPTLTISPYKKIKREEEGKKTRDHGINISKPLKKSRPKRGQYRKYNSQLLMEAVKAVQRGEMSVHRAGSYYGVPHSTLEYKVKERHLLRQKKIKEQKEAAARAAGTSLSVTNHSSNSNSSTGTDSEMISVKKEPEEEPSGTKTPLSTSWMPSYFSTATSIAGNTDLNFFGSSGYALSTPASELLRKLQHKVQTKADESDSCSNSGEGYVYIH